MDSPVVKSNDSSISSLIFLYVLPIAILWEKKAYHKKFLAKVAFTHWIDGTS